MAKIHEFMTNNREASYFVVDDYIILQGHHCRVSQTSGSFTNPGNIMILGNDIYTNQECEIICPPNTILRELVVIREFDPRIENTVIEIHLNPILPTDEVDQSTVY